MNGLMVSRAFFTLLVFLFAADAAGAAPRVIASIGPVHSLVAGVMDGNGRVLNNLDQRRANILRQSGVIRGGMIPKLEACLIALENVPQAEIIDGTQPEALLNCVQGNSTGTKIVRSF